MTKFISEKIRMKSASRLAAVQAMYMIEYGQESVDQVIKDFINGEVGRYVIEEDVEHNKEQMIEVSELDSTYFATLVRGVSKDKESLEKSISSYLLEGWSFERMDGTLRSLLLCAVYELAHTTDVDVKVLIQEYVDLAYAFFTKNEPKMVNALLDQIAREIR